MLLYLLIALAPTRRATPKGRLFTRSDFSKRNRPQLECSDIPIEFHFYMFLFQWDGCVCGVWLVGRLDAVALG